MPDVNWNLIAWDGYDWSDRGEGFSEPWGGSEAQWFGSLYPRLHRFLPAKNILEIGPGMGRWTKFLLPLCERYVGIDLSLTCVEGCRKFFAEAAHARFVANDGYSLSDVDDSGFDLVFSFNSLVHAEIDVLKSYVPQIIQKLNNDGVAFIHHSNVSAFGTALSQTFGRGASVSRENVEGLVVGSGGRTVIQEIINWHTSPPVDCLTLFARGGCGSAAPVHLFNLHFMEEAAAIKNFQAHYSRVGKSKL